MQLRKRSLGSRMLSGVLAAMMSVSLAISPLPGMVADYEGETVSAADTTSNAIYLPLTIRDVITNDTYLFHGPGTNYLSHNKLITVEPRLGANKTPVYNSEVLNVLALEVKNNTDSAITSGVSNLQLALNARMGNVLKSQTIEYWNNCSSGTDNYNGKFSSIGNCYDAAKWMTDNLFADKTFDDRVFVGGTDTDSTMKAMDGQPVTAANLYTFKYTGYEKLMLKYTNAQYMHKGTEPSNITSGHYYFDSMIGDVNPSNNKIIPVRTVFDRTNKIIKNDETNGLILNNCGNFFPLGSGRSSKVDAVDKNGTANKLDPLSLVGFKDTFGTSVESNVNAGFTTAGSGKFVYNEGEELFFGFRGDDDVYLYINNILVIDMGGTNDKTYGYVELNKPVHDEEFTIPNNPSLQNGEWINSNSESATKTNSRTAYATKTLLKDTAGNYVTADGKPLTNTTTWAEYLGLKDGGTYDFHFFQMERRSYGSGFDIHTNIRVTDSAAVPKKVAYDYTGTELGYGAYVLENSDITYGFQLTNSADSNSSQITNLEFKDEFGEGTDDDVILNEDTISLGAYTKPDGSKEARNITDIMYAVYDSNSTTTPVYERYSPTDDTPASWETEIKNVLKAGIERGKTISLRGFKYNTRENPSFLNTLNTTAVNSMNTTLYGMAKMLINTTSFANDVFVLDYAKPVTVTQEEVFHEELNNLNRTDADTQIKTEVTGFSLLSDTDGDNIVRNSNGYGALNLLKPSYNVNAPVTDPLLKYIPEKVLSGTDMFFVDVNIKTTRPETGSEPTNSTVSKPVTFIPANNVYYEDDFVTDESAGTVGIIYEGNWKTTDKAPSSENNKEIANTDVHGGWKNVDLANDLTYSDGSAHCAGFDNKTGATARFTFTGTGVDIYSRTDIETGMVLAMLFDGTDTNQQVREAFLMDNLAKSAGTEGYYQIPTVSFQNLPHGEYTVELMVSSASANETGSKRYLYYLDGIRVYNPLSDSSLYADKEKNANFKEIRDILIGENSFVAGTSEKGIVFIDEIKEGQGLGSGENADVEKVDTTTVHIGTYKDYGPKNEVYLAAGQAIVFKVNDANSKYFYLGLKAPDGATKAEVTNAVGDNTKAELNINSAADLYYEIKPYSINSTDNTGLVMVKNTGENLLSITKLRTTGATATVDPIAAISEEEVVTYARTFSTLRMIPYDEAEVEKPDNSTSDEGNVEIEGNDTIKSLLEVLLNEIFKTFRKWFR